MENQETKTTGEAVKFVRENKNLLIEKFANDLIYPSDNNPVSIFMAGSPGAGKTEFAKTLIEKYQRTDRENILRIDADEIRNLIPGYNGANADTFHKAASRGVDILHSYALKKNKNFVLDGTFSNLNKATENITRSLKRDRETLIFYIYQDPLVAWEFTKKRERLEGRRVPKESFVEKLFLCHEIVSKTKQQFGDKIEIYFVRKDFRHNEQHVDDISDIKIEYTKDELYNLLP